MSTDVIKLLPDSVANQIAAGEVIQRPASVIKELVENAIDASATEVEIILKEAGRNLIQVVDNGCGMSDTDARLAFERHSTSKIRSAADLFALHTMGFRGEALASIAAIAQVELRTRREGETLGTRLLINGSQCELQEPVACPLGSNFMIKNLFFNVPARRKFLKSNRVELSNIIHEFEKLALINNTVRFTVVHDGRLLYKLQEGSFLQRICAVFGHSLEQQLLPVDIDTPLVRVTGFIGRVEHARRRGALQYLFVNERYMRHPYFHKAIMACYEQLIPADHQPNYFLRFTVDPQAIDVNIHPTKTEIKFEDEMPIWQILNAGVKATLGRFNDVPSIDFDTEGQPEIKPFSTEVAPPPLQDLDPNYNPFADNARRAAIDASKAATTEWQQLYARFENDHSKQEPEGNSATQRADNELFDVTGGDASLFLQLKGKYIITPARSGLMVIDQHRAHTLILYNTYTSAYNEGIKRLPAQRLLFPVDLPLSAQQSATLSRVQPMLETIGFVLRSSGDSWQVIALPADVDTQAVADVIDDIIIRIADIPEGSEERALRQLSIERIALSVATRAAMPYGKVLSGQEMEHLVSQLLRLEAPNYTPGGKLILSIVPFDYFTKLFQ